MNLFYLFVVILSDLHTICIVFGCQVILIGVLQVVKKLDPLLVQFTTPFRTFSQHFLELLMKKIKNKTFSVKWKYTMNVLFFQNAVKWSKGGIFEREGVQLF